MLGKDAFVGDGETQEEAVKDLGTTLMEILDSYHAMEKRFEESSIIWLTGKNYYLISDKCKKPKPGESVRYQIVREVPE